MIDRRIGKIKLRRGTDIQRRNVALEEGEFVYTTDKQRLFIGDGMTIGGILVSSRNFITNAYGVPEKAEHGDIVHDQSAGKTYIVNNSNNVYSLILIADADCCRKLQLRIDDLMTRMRTLSSCLLADEGTGTIDEGDDGTGIIVDKPPTLDNTSTIAWAINIFTPAPVILGQTLTFTASAVGVGNISYKWNKIGTGDLPGKTSNTLSIGPITDASLGSYRCIATSDIAGSIVSNTATVTKAATPLTWIIQPEIPIGSTISYGSTFTAIASAIGDGTITYKWFKDGVGILPTQTSNILTLTNIQPSDTGFYKCIAKSTNSQTITSNQIDIEVFTNSLAWVREPLDSTGELGYTIVLSASATGSGNITYEWKKVSPTLFEIPGETRTTYTINNLSPSVTGVYAAIAHSSLGQSITSTATINMVYDPAIDDVFDDGNYLLSDNKGFYIKAEDDTYIRWNDPSDSGAGIDFTGVNIIDGGMYHTLAVGIDGTLSAWGGNNDGAIGDGTNIKRDRPVKINLPPIKSVAAGNTHSLALGVDGTLSAWGNNSQGQLGNGTRNSSNVPVKINLPPVKSVAAKINRTIALGIDGTLSGWGYPYSYSYNDPIKLFNLPAIKTISMGELHTLALGVDGTLSAWGNNYYGQIGDGTSNNRDVPVKINIPPIKAIAVGFNHSLALGVDGRLYAWGDNQYGQLGIGTTINSKVPITLNLPAIQAIAAFNHTLVLGVDGTLSAWGENKYRQLLNGVGNENSLVPIKINLPMVKSIAVGERTSFAIGVNNALSAWGSNSQGQLGAGSIVVIPVVVDIPSLI